MPSPFLSVLPALKRPAISPLMLFALVFSMSVIGGALVWRFAQIQENRELVQWQNKLNLIADSRSAAVENWLSTHMSELGAVAGNPSLQLYVTELLTTPPADAPPTEEPAQTVFLRNLLSITADRLGFVDKPSAEIQSINANVAQPSGVGLAIVNADGKILVSTLGLTSFNDDLAAKIADAGKDQPSLLDIFPTDGANRIGFALPIYPIQSEAAKATPIGKLVGVKTVNADFFKLLRHPGVTERTLEAFLLRRQGNNVEFLSPTTNGNVASQLALTTPELDASYALTSPGVFALKRDRESRKTLMTSRAIAGSPWTMLLHIERDQALAESDRWRRQTVAIMFFALLAVIGGIVASWFYGSSRRTLLLSLKTGRLASQLAAREKLLRVVADNQLEPIIIVDEKNVAHFANDRAAQIFHMAAAEMAGKDLVALMGPVLAKDYAEANQQALKDKAPVIRTWQREEEKGVRVTQSAHVPLPHLPIDRLPVPSPGVLIIDQDVTGIVNERERRARTLNQVINSLVFMVDKRDPYASNHSVCVAVFAHEVARLIGLNDTLVETAEVAGKLMNVGKIVVPTQLLTRNASLADNEILLIRKSLQLSASLLDGIEFDGPVVETLRQVQENYDGSGPLGLEGENILITARIVAAMNAFVGMVSPRAYHEAMPVEKAIQTMLADGQKRFDRRVVVALANFLENNNGKEIIARLIAKSGG